MNADTQVTRRAVLGGLAATAAGIPIRGTRVRRTRAAVEPARGSTYDVIVVGGGAAGFSAALGAKRADPNASVVVLENRPSYGGTSYRSGGRLWIPNNADMRAVGLRDPKDMAVRYMAKLAYPDRYDARAPHLGLDPRHARQLGAYYDNGSEMLDYYRAAGILPWHAEQFEVLPGEADPLRLHGHFAPDYHPELEEDVPKVGRAVLPAHFDPTGTTHGAALNIPDYGTSIYGPDLIEWLHYAAVRQGVTVLPSVRVVDLLMERGGGRGRGGTRAVGVRTAPTVGTGTVASEPIANVTIPVYSVCRARRGVIFTTGGFSKDPVKLAANFTGVRSFTGGGCAVRSAVGDFVDLGMKHGFMLENMDQAWFIENVFEQYMLDPNSELGPNYLAFQAYFLNGDSMLVVNRLGLRVYNEKQNYNDRGQVHFHPDNRFLLSVFDEHCIQHHAGLGGEVTPAAQTFIGPSATTADLQGAIAARLRRYPQTAPFILHADFARRLDQTLARFNRFARSGRDVDFHRGESLLDIWWHALLCLTFQGYDVPGAGVRDCVAANTDDHGRPYPNPTMRPLEPPYYAVILASGLQDTKGGPAIDEHARVLDVNERPVEGLYGAGNCIGSPAGAAYWGAGGTLGPATVFGHIAGRHAATHRR
ncbi:MAG: FAD-dependent oxidoreductase [Acidimicrobiales bacterium]